MSPGGSQGKGNGYGNEKEINKTGERLCVAPDPIDRSYKDGPRAELPPTLKKWCPQEALTGEVGVREAEGQGGQFS